MYPNCVCWAVYWLSSVVSCSCIQYTAMPVVVLQLLEQVTWLSYWELAASAGAVIVVVVRPDGCDEHEWPEKLGGVALHCIGFVTQGQGVAAAGAFAP